MFKYGVTFNAGDSNNGDAVVVGAGNEGYRNVSFVSDNVERLIAAAKETFNGHVDFVTTGHDYIGELTDVGGADLNEIIGVFIEGRGTDSECVTALLISDVETPTVIN